MIKVIFTVEIQGNTDNMTWEESRTGSGDNPLFYAHDTRIVGGQLVDDFANRLALLYGDIDKEKS